MANKLTLDKNQRQSLILVTGLAVGYFAILKPILNRLHLTKSEEEKNREKRRKKQLDEKVKEETKRVARRKSDAELQIVADNIYENIATSWWSDEKEKAAGILYDKITTDSDMWQLIKLFGRRQEYWYGLPTGGLKDMETFMKTNFSADQIRRLNNGFRLYKMKYRL
jgi:hypothetical protein